MLWQNLLQHQPTAEQSQGEGEDGHVQHVGAEDVTSGHAGVAEESGGTGGHKLRQGGGSGEKKGTHPNVSPASLDGDNIAGGHEESGGGNNQDGGTQEDYQG